jgi:transcription elongation factor GreB
VQLVDPAAQVKRDQVFFGATVTYARASDDAEATITIVGVDEADAEAGRVAWIAPVARALLGAKQGDVRRVRTPGGVEEIEVVSITYPG